MRYDVRINFEKDNNNNVQFADYYFRGHENFLAFNAKNMDDFCALVKDKDKVKKVVEQYYEYVYGDDNYDHSKYLEELLNKMNEALENAATVTINENVDVLELMEKFPVLTTKKVIIQLSENIIIEKLVNKYSVYSDNIYVQLRGEDKLISLSELYDIFINSKKVTNEINNLELSPIEKVVYAYDVVRTNEYKNIDLAKVFEMYLRNFNIKYLSVKLLGKDGFHYRTRAYIKDDKYAIDGIYDFDPTFDSKKSDYLLTYHYFGKVIDRMQRMDTIDESVKHLNLKEIFNFEVVETYDQIKKEVMALLNCESYFELIKRYKMYLENLNSLIDNEVIFDENFIDCLNSDITEDDIERLKTKIYTIFNKCEDPICDEVFSKILINTRELDYYKKFGAKYNNINTILLNSKFINYYSYHHKHYDEQTEKIKKKDK